MATEESKRENQAKIMFDEMYKQDAECALRQMPKFVNLEKFLRHIEAEKSRLHQLRTSVREETNREPGRQRLTHQIRKQFDKLVKTIKHSDAFRSPLTSIKRKLSRQISPQPSSRIEIINPINREI